MIVIHYADSYIVKNTPKLVICIFGLTFSKLCVKLIKLFIKLI
jgi:hypothetical protein